MDVKEKTPVWFVSYRSPVGEVFVATTTQGITDAAIGVRRDGFIERLRLKYGCVGREHTKGGGPTARILQNTLKCLERYFGGKDEGFELPLHPCGTDFERRVWEEIKRIPYGQVRSYGEVAASIGAPRATRAVGGACGRNPRPLIVPCHRVVSSRGGLGGYTAPEGVDGLKIKKALLAIEAKGKGPLGGTLL